MRRTLYDIDMDILALFENAEVDEETGEYIIDMEALNDLQMEREQKVRGVTILYKDRKAFIAALKEEKKALDKRIKREENLLDRLGEWLTNALQGKKYECTEAVVSFRKSQIVAIDEGAELPEEFLRTKTTVEPNKVALKEALKDGEIIKGVALVDNVTMTVK